MKSVNQLLSTISEIEGKLGYTFKDKQKVVLAFTHRSYVNENRRETTTHNERLEFLGDAVLGLLVSDYLYRYLPMTAEGELSQLRSRLVEAGACACYVRKLDVEPYLLLGKGERKNAGKGRISILSDLFEAIVGAVFLDGGLEAVRGFFFSQFSQEIQSVLEKPLRNFKAELQDFSQKRFQEPPVYVVVEEEGPDHSKTFRVAVEIAGRRLGEGVGASKKEAQQLAAEQALCRLEQED